MHGRAGQREDFLAEAEDYSPVECNVNGYFRIAQFRNTNELSVTLGLCVLLCGFTQDAERAFKRELTAICRLLRQTSAAHALLHAGTSTAQSIPTPPPEIRPGLFVQNQLAHKAAWAKCTA